MSHQARAALARVEAYLQRRGEMQGLDGDINIVWRKDEPLPLSTDDLKIITDKLRSLMMTNTGPETCNRAVPDPTGVSRAYTCGLRLRENGECPRPLSEHVQR